MMTYLLGRPFLPLELPDAHHDPCDVTHKTEACSRHTGEVADHTFLLLLGLLVLLYLGTEQQEAQKSQEGAQSRGGEGAIAW